MTAPGVSSQAACIVSCGTHAILAITLTACCLTVVSVNLEEDRVHPPLSSISRQIRLAKAQSRVKAQSDEPKLILILIYLALELHVQAVISRGRQPRTVSGPGYGM